MADEAPVVTGTDLDDYLEPDAPISEAAAPDAESAPATPEPEPTAQPRTPEGRFAPKAPTADTPAPADPAAPANAAPAPPSEPAASPEPETKAEDYPPFSYRGPDGREQTVPGALVGSDGVFFPADRLPELQHLYAQVPALERRLTDAGRREKAAASRAEAAEAQAKAITDQIEHLIESGQIGDWLQQVQVNWPVLKAEAKARGIELRSKADADRLAELEQEREAASLQPQMDEALERSVLQFGQQAGLDQAELQAVYQRLQSPRFKGLIFVRAQDDIPAQGIRKGELVIDYGVIRDEIKDAVEWKKRYAGSAPAAKVDKQVEAAKAANAAAAAARAKAPAPAVTGKQGVTGGKPKPTGKQYAGMSAREIDDDIFGAGFDDL